jgi:transposase InsO family protein
VNFVSNEFIRKTGTVVKRFGSSVQIILGDGSSSKTGAAGFATLKQIFDNESQLHFDAVVSPLNKGFDMILGKPWLQKTKAVHDHGSPRLLVNTGNGQFSISLKGKMKEVQEPIVLSHKEFVKLITKEQEDVVEMFMIKFVIANTGVQSLPNNSADLTLLLNEFQDILPKEKSADALPNEKLKALGNYGKHQINLMPNSVPHKKLPYRMSPRQLEEVKTQIQTLLDQGKIRPSSSPWSSPVLFALKKDGSLRMCVDYRVLNRLSIPDSTPLPRILDNLDKLGQSCVFSVVDLESGFNQIPMDPESIPLTAFSTRYGQFEYLVMPFGLRNAPSTFQRVMNLVLEGLVDDFCVVYIDDILVFSNDREEHISHLRKVLQRLQKYGLICNIKKSQFIKDSVEYCGHVVSQGNVSPSPDKTKVISNWTSPKSATEVRSFLGLCNFYRRFVQNYTSMAKPLLDLTKKDATFIWTNIHEDAFNSLKTALVSEPVLATPDYTKDMHVWPDASQFAVGGVLTQEYLGGHRPIAYFSKKLSDSEQKYPTHEREFYAIVSCLKAWRCYLDGLKITVHTDHKPLTWSRGLKDPRPRVWGWIQEVESFAPSIVYQKGSEQPGDALSRINVTKASVPDSKAPLNGEVIPNLPFSRVSGHAEKAAERSSDGNLRILNNVYIYNGLELQDSDWPYLVEVKLKGGVVPQDLSQELSELIGDQEQNFDIISDVLHRKVKIGSTYKFLPFALSKDRKSIISQYHITLGHLAAKATLDIIRERYWWPDLKTDVYAYVAQCQECDLIRRDYSSVKAPLHAISPSALPFQRWGIDFIEKLPKSQKGNVHIVTAIDYFSRYVVAKAVKVKSGKAALNFLYEEIITKFGVPEVIITDRAKAFMEGEFQEYLKKMKIRHTPTSSYHPRSNGMVERMHSTLKNMLRKLSSVNIHRWDDHLNEALLAMRIRRHSVTQFSPFYLLYGVHPRLPGDPGNPTLFDLSVEDDIEDFTARELHQLGQDRYASLIRSQRQAKDMERLYRERNNVIDKRFIIGQYVKRKVHGGISLNLKWDGPYIITEVLENSLYRLMMVNGTILDTPVHQDDLAPYTSNSSDQYYHNRRLVSNLEGGDMFDFGDGGDDMSEVNLGFGDNLGAFAGVRSNEEELE